MSRADAVGVAPRTRVVALQLGDDLGFRGCAAARIPRSAECRFWTDAMSGVFGEAKV